MRLPYARPALEEQLRSLQHAVLCCDNAASDSPPATPTCVEAFGRALRDALLKGDVGRVYDDSLLIAMREGKRLRIRLRCTEPLLEALPWEFMFDSRQGEFLLLSRKLSVVRYLEMRGLTAPLEVMPPLRILVMLASPRGLPALDVAREKRWLQKALAGLVRDGLVEVRWLESGSWRDLQQALRSGPWHVFHFIGHGGFDEGAGEGFLTVVDQGGGPKILLASEARRLLEAHPTMRLALLNSCQGAEESWINPHASTAAALVLRGIPAVIAMQYPISDDAASEFSRSLYEALRDGLPVDGAVAEARIAVRTAMRNSLEWGTPVLFTRASDTVLFELQPRETPDEVEPYRQEVPPPCPYPGMAAFREEDAAVFCGRDEVVEELCTAVRRQCLTAVVGISGSGKSSVVFAGLVPRLRHEEDWTILDCRPGEQPLLALATAFVAALASQGGDTTELLEAQAMASALGDGRLTLPAVAARLLEKRGARRLLLIVDQFEELYTLCAQEAERQAFIDGLLALTRGAGDRGPGACAVVLTLRADFYGATLTHGALRVALQTAGLNLGPMSPEELQYAIATPAQQLGVRFEAGLIDRLIAEVCGGPGRLPLLQMALTKLWAQQHGGTMTHAAYEAIGGVQQALARRADEVFEGLQPEQQERARRVFVRLVRLGDGTADTRRRATRGEIGSENWNLVAYLADARLLVTGQDPATRQDFVEIVHEALIDRWRRLRAWIDADRAFLGWQERLRSALRQWEATNRDEGALLRGASLVEAERWLAERERDLGAVEREYIEAGVEQRQCELVAKERQRADRERLQRRLSVGAACAAVALAVFASFAGVQCAAATSQSHNANRQRQIALARQLAAQSLTFTHDQPDLALLLGLEADRLTDSREMQANLRDRLVDNASLVSFWSVAPATGPGPSGPFQAQSVAVSPDGRILAAGGWDDSVRLWDGVAHRAIGAPLAGHRFAVTSLAFSADGRELASADHGGAIEIWNVETRQSSAAPLVGQGSGVAALAFSPDGAMLAAGGFDGSIHLWTLSTREPLATLDSQAAGVKGVVNGVAFSRDGRTLASGSDDGSVVLWDLAERRPSGAPLNGHSGAVAAVAFRQDDSTLAAAGADGVHLWDVATGRPLGFPRPAAASGPLKLGFDAVATRLITARGAGIYLWDLTAGPPLAAALTSSAPPTGIVFSPDGTTLAVGNRDGSIVLWDAASHTPIGSPIAMPAPLPAGTREPESNPVNGVAFTPDGTTLVSGGRDGALHLWDVAGRRPLGAPLTGHKGAVTRVAVGGDGNTAFSGGADGDIRIWDLRSRQSLEPPLTGPQTSHVGGVSALAVSHDGSTLASGGFDGVVRLWDVRQHRSLGEPLARGGAVTDIAISRDDKTLAVAFADGSVRLWDLGTRRQLSPVALSSTGPSDAVSRLAFSPDGRTLAMGGGDGAVHLWDVPGNRQLGEALPSNASVSTLAYSPDGTTLASTGADGTIVLWDLVPDSWRKRACAIAGRDLTPAEWSSFLPQERPQPACSGVP